VHATFELIRFQLTPASGAVAVIELEGRPAAPVAGRPVLLLEGPVEAIELPAIVEPDGDADGVLRASFAAPLELAVDDATTFALSLGRGPLLELPAPDDVGDATLEVRLARTVNALRRELHVTRSQLADEVGVTRRRLAERDEQVAREIAAEREGAAAARAEAERRAAAAREQAERQAAAERDAAAAAVAERDRLRAELDDAREELDELRGELASARARIAALESAAATHRMPRTPRHPPPRRHPRPPRPLRDEEPTEQHEPVARTNHASLGRGVARAAALMVLALMLAALVVLVLQVRVV